MDAPQGEFYSKHETEVWLLFDFRVFGTGRRLRQEMYAWKSCASMERLDQHHGVLIVRPGGARRIAR